MPPTTSTRPKHAVELDAPGPGRLTMTGFCAYPGPGSHGYCDQELVARGKPCTCPCHSAETPPSREGFGENLTGWTAGYPEPHNPVPGTPGALAVPTSEEDSMTILNNTAEIPVKPEQAALPDNVTAKKKAEKPAPKERVVLDIAELERRMEATQSKQMKGNYRRKIAAMKAAQSADALVAAAKS